MVIGRLNIGQKIFLGFGIVIFMMLLVIGNNYINFTKESQAVKWSVHTYQVVQASDGVLISLLNMETGARGYVITGDESFLQPFNDGNSSYEKYYNELNELTADNSKQQRLLSNVKSQYGEWLKWEKNDIIANRQKVSSGQLKLEDLVSLIQSGRGKNIMNNLHLTLGKVNIEEEKLLQSRNVDLGKMERETKTIMILGAILAAMAAVIIAKLAANMVVNPVKVVTNTFKEIAEGDVNLEVRLRSSSRDELGNMAKYFNVFMAKLKELICENMDRNWITTGRVELNEAIRGVHKIDILSSRIISHMCRYFNVQIGIFYINTDYDTFEISGSYAYNSADKLPNEFKIGEGLIGQSALEKRTILVENVPVDYIKIISGTGKYVPKNILIVPCIYHDRVECIMELGSFNEFTKVQLKFIEQASPNIAMTVNLVKSQKKMKDLLDKTLAQSEELQVQQEELRQNNEELEEQAKILRQSEMNLQTQQEELRVSNEELEEQTIKLEQQKVDIIKNNELLQKANYKIEEKVKELEIANKYKSEFLANMSHELRTPLNSILVLSQLLGNKKDTGPLSDKHLEYAKTIHSSGKNLLRLINEILDLSKVEAGKMDINLEKVSLIELMEDTKKLFNPIALQKNVDFKVQIEKALPEEIISDKQRIQQIINNLLSNAFKFTSHGYVKMNIFRVKENHGEYFNIKSDIRNLIGIEVRDTGIGIHEDKQKLIFEAFKQVDGTISRKYGGTGLGLSISRQLANLLGGTIYLKSQEGMGSTFTLVIPNNNDILEIGGSTSKNFKKILIVDKNREQTKIICDNLVKKGFHVTVLDTGLSAYELLKEERFDCMILDPDLRDISGLEFLDKLKYEDMINFHVLIHTESITKEDEVKLNKYTESIIIKGKKSMERLLGEASLFFHGVDSKADNKKTENIKSSYEKENLLINKKILIVDDDMRNVFSLTNALEEKGMDVIIGRNGTEGIEKLYQYSEINLIIMDVMMPEMDGYTAMKEIRKHQQFKDIPIIALTAKAMKAERQKCIEVGANDYLTKPVEIDKLISLLKVWLYR